MKRTIKKRNPIARSLYENKALRQREVSSKKIYNRKKVCKQSY